jgi:hypothetical protein
MLPQVNASAWVSAVSALIALVALAMTLWQARSAKAQADAAKRQAAAATRQTELQEQIYRDSHQPYVWADFRPDPVTRQMIRLVIRNEGPTVATDVGVVFDPPLESPDAEVRFGERACGVLASGLPSMPPGKEMSWNFGRGFVVLADGNKTLRYKVTITGQGPFGDMPTLEYLLDLEDLRGVAAAHGGSLQQIAKSVDELRNSINAAALSKLVQD